jgi:hypothetical protein
VTLTLVVQLLLASKYLIELPLCLKHARDLVSLVVSLGERIFMSCMVAVLHLLMDRSP